ncbi:protein FAM83G [Gastrophryne carolinensis]
MALSQLQCLDNNNVNWRSSETKPEFFYSEEQRLALERLVSIGPDAYQEVVKKENIRDFLSELELSKIPNRVEAFDPDSSHPRKNGEKSEQEGDEELQQDGEEQSLEYWPDRSDCSIPELDLGWPDTVAYRGVTRATVYMQPPIDGQPHIKEVVRKMITQAQRVIALVMDLFTDVDIFKDMLEAGFKRKISVYIILSESDVKYFLQMCERANMHQGHLKNLRVRTVGGTEFHTRFATKFKGSLGQKFMFVDGDKTMCGSYSFTWSAARIDRNLITVLSGQVVETFDRQFQELYLVSKGVSLKNIPMDNEPEPEPIIQPVSIPTGPPEAIAKKLINPKYALVNVKSASEAGKNSKEAEAVKKLSTKPRLAARDLPTREQPIHPGLQDLERANMFEYLPTWVEPDPEPGSEILGYINIIDPNIKNAQPSQMNRIKICDTSQATAQYLQHTKEMERKKREDLEEKEKLSRESSRNLEPVRGHGAESYSKQTRQEERVVMHSKEASRQASTEQNNAKRSLSRQASQGQKSEHDQGISTTQSSQDLSHDLSQTNGVPSLENESTKNVAKQHLHEDLADQATQHGDSTATPMKGFANLAESQHLVSHKPPPVPKPRTMPVTDFISLKNTLNAKSVGTPTPTEDIAIPFVNGVDETDAKQIDILIDNEPRHNEDEDSAMYTEFSREYSSSGSGSLPQSNSSSMSEEYYPSNSLQRRGSDRIPNGERPPPHRKMSDGHISRGSFLSPYISQSLMEMRPQENGIRRNTLEEELTRALSSSQPLQGKDRIYSMEPAQVCTDTYSNQQDKSHL